MKNHSFCSTFLESQVIFYLFSLGIAFIPTTSALAATLSLNDYLKQVVQTSPGVAASQELIQGTVESSLEKDLPSMPSLFFQGTHTVDERQFSSSFLGGRTKSDNYSLGVQEQFDFGLNARLSYGLFSNNTSNLPAFIYPPNGTSIYTSAQTELDLTQSLWRNFLGKETRATEQVAEATSLASHYAEKFKLKQTLAAAETAYHTLAIASELVKLQRGLLDGSKRILDWNTRRVRNHLTDRIDELQSQADFQSRQLQLDTSLASVRTAKLSFNSLRNQVSDELNEEVVLAPVDTILALSAPKKAETTDDVKAAEQTEKLTRASNELSLQKAQPDLLLLGTAAFNGVDYYSSPAISRSFTTNNPLYTIGLKFTFPIYFWETSEIRGGRVKQQLAAEHATTQKRIDSDQTWSDLVKRLGEAQARLKLATELVSLQKEKMEYEKHRLDLGRTTTYQVLVFEQDYSQSIISELTIEQEILNIHSQLKTYAQD